MSVDRAVTEFLKIFLQHQLKFLILWGFLHVLAVTR